MIATIILISLLGIVFIWLIIKLYFNVQLKRLKGGYNAEKDKSRRGEDWQDRGRFERDIISGANSEFDIAEPSIIRDEQLERRVILQNDAINEDRPIKSESGNRVQNNAGNTNGNRRTTKDALRKFLNRRGS